MNRHLPSRQNGMHPPSPPPIQTVIGVQVSSSQLSLNSLMVPHNLYAVTACTGSGATSLSTCDGLGAWSSEAVYDGGSMVVYKYALRLFLFRYSNLNREAPIFGRHNGGLRGKLPEVWPLFIRKDQGSLYHCSGICVG